MKELVDPDEHMEGRNPIQLENDNVDPKPSRPTNLDVNCIKSLSSRSKQR